MNHDYPQKVLQKIKTRQWALADFDWDEPGAEMITDEQREKLKAFMSDLIWIENVGARGFAAMAKKAPNDTLKEIYTYFHAEEQRHANAEMALMRRWGMLAEDELPEPNPNLRQTIQILDAYADDMKLIALGTVIPMLEVALDGALCQFLLDSVEDPLCHKVFARINDDESRHLAVGFHVLEMLSQSAYYRQVIEFAANAINPKVLLSVLVYLPLLNRMRDNVVNMGVPEERLYAAMERFGKVGGRVKSVRRNPFFRAASSHGRTVTNRNHPYHIPVNFMVRLSDYFPSKLLPSYPTWVRELTWKPTSKSARNP